MSKDKIEVSMNVYDIPIVVEALEKANKEIERLHSIIKEVRECINRYAIENEDYSKIYNNEEKKLLEILDKAGSDKECVNLI